MGAFRDKFKSGAKRLADSPDPAIVAHRENVVVVRNFGSEGSAGGDSPLAGVQPTIRSEVVFDMKAALSIAALYRVMGILTTAVASMRPTVKRNGKEIPTPSLIRKPDVNSTTANFIEETVSSMALSGDAYWRIYRIDNAISNLVVLNPFNVTPELDEKTGRMVYEYDGKRLNQNEVKHLKLLRVPGRIRGLGPIEANQRELMGTIDLRNYAANWFAGDGLPAGEFDTGVAKPTKEILSAYRAEYTALMNSYNRILFVGKDAGFKPYALTPEEAQFLAMQQWHTMEVARVFGVPAALMDIPVDGTSMTYTNLSMVDTQLWKYTLSQYAVEIEGKLTELLPNGQFVYLDATDLLRPDHKTRAEINQIYVAMGAKSPEQVAVEENFELPAQAPAPLLEAV